MTATPNLFVIGAGKSGTTSLHAYLDSHPEVAMSAIKEPNFFVGEGIELPWRWGRVANLDQYRELFDPTAAVRGEASTSYTEYPELPGVPARIRKLAPEAKLIYMVRDPIERLHSAYMQRATAGAVGSFEQVLGEVEDPGNEFVCPSRFMTQIDQYLEHFPATALAIVDQNDLLERRQPTLERIFEFLGVDPGFRSPAFDELANVGSGKRHHHPGFARLNRSRVAWALSRPIPSGVRRRLARGVRGRLGAPVERPELEPAMRARLVAELEPEVARLREFSGQAFKSWSI